jgi:hypothetical protein
VIHLTKLVDGLYQQSQSIDGVFTKQLIDAGYIEACGMISLAIHKGWHDADTIIGTLVRSLI